MKKRARILYVSYLAQEPDLIALVALSKRFAIRSGNIVQPTRYSSVGLPESSTVGSSSGHYSS